MPTISPTHRPARHPVRGALILRAAALAVALLACGSPARQEGDVRTGDPLLDAPRLPTGQRLDPAGALHDAGQMPLAMALSPEGDRVLLLLSGWREQGLQVIDRASGRVLQTLKQRGAFLGLAFAPGAPGATRSLWTSGAERDVVYRYDWSGGAATLADSIVLHPHATKDDAPYYAAGLAFSPDGRALYVAENLADSLAVVDVASGQVVQRVATGRYPYAVAVAASGTVYVSDWGARTVSTFAPAPQPTRLTSTGRIDVARHPSALLLAHDGSRLFVASGSTDRVAVVDTRARRVIAELADPPPGGVREGSTPNALALSRDGTRLFVAEADANAVAVFDLGAATSGVPVQRKADVLAGRVPTAWYPVSLALGGDTLLVASGKGRGTRANPQGPTPVRKGPWVPDEYTLGQLAGALGVLGPDELSAPALAAGSTRVARANGWTDGARARARRLPPIEHVIYVIKENRTYDQVLGDLPQADGDTSLVFFPRAVTPNHHALAERFGIYDRFLVNAEVSADGHNWSLAAYATDYLQKTTPSQYSDHRPDFDYDGTNRGEPAEGDEDAAEPAEGYLWTLAERARVSYRNYGEFMRPRPGEKDIEAAWRGANTRATKAYLRTHTSPDYPGYDLRVTDQRRIGAWLRELEAFVRADSLPALQTVLLPSDHTSGASAGRPTPRAHMADNDLALGRLVDAISRTRFWKSTAIFVVEDDAQNGADHVDSHRAPFLLISPWARGGVHHRFTNTTDVLATIEELLGLDALSQFDRFGRPLLDVWAREPDARPYAALTPAVPLDEKNPPQGRGASESRLLDLSREDAADETLFNGILWRAVKGEHVPQPAPRRASTLEMQRGH